MVDYIDLTPPPAIVQYVDEASETLELPDYDILFPDSLWIHGYREGTFIRTINGVECIYRIYATGNIVVPNAPILDTHYNLLRQKVRRVSLQNYGDHLLTQEEYVGAYYACDDNEYTLNVVSSEGVTLYRITADDFTPDTAGDFEIPSDDDVFFLYKLGQLICNSGMSFKDLLGIEINGSGLFYILFFGGFTVYVGWCIVKWVIPT